MGRPEDRRRVHARIRGRVQGVWFRGSTQREAMRLGVDGWVRNLYDGSVELLAEGPADRVQALLDWARSGPPGARVDALDADDETPLGTRGGFEVRPSSG